MNIFVNIIFYLNIFFGNKTSKGMILKKRWGSKKTPDAVLLPEFRQKIKQIVYNFRRQSIF